MANKEREWFISAELPLIFSDLLSQFGDFAPLLALTDPAQQLISPKICDIPTETIPLSSTLKLDHVKGHIKMKGALICKTELSIEINNTPVPVKTVVCIKEEEHNPWRLYQLGHAANYLRNVRECCEDVTNGKVTNSELALHALDYILDQTRRCKLQFVLPKQESTSTFNKNYCVFTPDLPPGILVNFHIKDIKLVLTISCLKNPQDLHVKDKYSVPKTAYIDRTLMLNVHWLTEIYERLTVFQNEVQLVYQKLCVFRETQSHTCRKGG